MSALGTGAGPRLVTVGVGTCAGVHAEEVLDVVVSVLAAVRTAAGTGGREPFPADGAASGGATALATVQARAAEPGLLAAARRLDLPLIAYDARTLARVRVPHPSDFSRTAVGTPSVAEAAALLACGGGSGTTVQGGAPVLLVPKTKSRPAAGAPVRATAAVAALAVPGRER
ncbi:cobalamin biosynthesis protein [Streptomyces qinglanensis]|uniref:Histidinol-phosphate aminotransferase/cobalt-precorrin 5A hydrolase/sirohydrochlorin cobaltochelatase n=1 Tax=Streptomyces qinglanensis TaxID=943816 RepID=A0A1H9N3J4_9ACTN|nr:cobalamin biosynthesis protein [Streptomyces qinglanensis]SER30259.1 histidinol-phosphate aminotransferase/cobalt-precorrin 5A hydrolase/sirohydrochlorin cobaltochelatase [Streptomyces qinglanensis]